MELHVSEGPFKIFSRNLLGHSTLNIFCHILALENQIQRLQADKSVCNDVKLYCCIHITSLLQKVFLTFRSQSRLKTCRFFKGVQIIYNVLVFIRLNAAEFIRFFLIRLRRLFKCSVYKSAAFIFKSTCLCFSRYRSTASTFQNSDILTQRHFWRTYLKSIIETFQKLIIFDRFGEKKRKYGFCVINYAKIMLMFDQVENDFFQRIS